jgi:CelD/BcsL family acetyltransferase involved in cellulose biosynthesis
MLRIEEISSYEEFRGIENAWRDLISKAGIDNPYLTYDWIEPYVKNCCNGKKLMILMVFDGGVLAGIAPLMVRKYSFMGITVRSVCFIGTGESDTIDFIIDASKEKYILSIMDYLMNINKDWDFLDFQEIPEHSGTVETIEKWLSMQKLKYVSSFRDKIFFVNLKSDVDSLLNKFSRRLHVKMKKSNKKIKGNLEFRRYAPNELKENLFSDIQFIAKHSWKAEEQKSIFLQEKVKNFHREFFLSSAKSGYLDVSILKLDNIPIAHIYNILSNNILHNYCIDFNARYSPISPGTMLMLWVIKDSVLRGLKEIDFGRGEEEWKERLTRDFRIQVKVRVFNSSFYGKGLYLLYSGIEFIKGHKTIYKILRRVKHRFLEGMLSLVEVRRGFHK